MNNSRIRLEDVMHMYRYVIYYVYTVSVVLVGQSVARSSVERCQRTLGYCRNKMMMHMALGVLTTIVTDLTN